MCFVFEETFLAMFTVMLDLDSITDELEREATVGIIHNCKLCIAFSNMCFL